MIKPWPGKGGVTGAWNLEDLQKIGYRAGNPEIHKEKGVWEGSP